MKKFISWNVNGLRACMGKGFMDFFDEIDADIFCLQETKLQAGQIDLPLTGYHQFWNYAEKKGYSGTAMFCKEEPLGVTYGIGDLNVAHTEIDLKNSKTNRKNAGFTDEERAKMTALLASGFTDTYRRFYPDTEGVYSWWSYRFRAREKNAGWRIDYFITSKSIDDKLLSAAIHTEVFGSDHCPVELTADL